MLIGALAATLAVAGCASDGTPAPASGSGGAPSIKNGAKVDAEQFKAGIETPGTVILDVRTPAEFAEGHIEGALNIDVQSDFANEIAKLDKATSYAVYCRSGNRSQTALNAMAKAGFEHAYHLGGGIGAWTKAGYPVVTG